MSERVSVWSYPWDLHDIGLDAALARIEEAGGNCVSLATSYHAGRFLQPGNPRRRVYFPEDGTVYYRPDPARWAGGEIVPKMAEIVDTEGDMLQALVDRREAGGPAVSCWTVCLHNTRLGMLHPAHVTRTAFGDPNWYALCPSSPAARAYLTTMTAEISARYRPDRIELESPDFMGFQHGFHHEKDGLGLTAEDSFLLGLCFCPHCHARASAAGVDIAAAQATVARHLSESFARELPERQFPDFPAKGKAAFDGVPEIAAFLEWRQEPVTSLIAQVREATHPDTEVLLIDLEGAWTGGISVRDATAACDGALLCVYFEPADRVAGVVERYRAEIGSDKTLVAGFQLFHPQVADAGDLARRVAAVRDNVSGLNFYNLGLVPPARFGWVAAALGR